jgi:hypothetical protein
LTAIGPGYRETVNQRIGGRHVVVIAVSVAVAVLGLAMVIVVVKQFARAVDPTAGGHRVTGPANGRDAARLDLVSGVTSVMIRAGDFGSDMYRVSTPDDGKLLPHVVEHDDRIQVQLSSSGENGASSVLIELAEHVVWHIRIGGGAQEVLVNMAAGRFAGLDLATGVTTVDATLPHPSGTVTVRVGGGAGQIAMHVPDGVPARVVVGGGAADVRLDGRSERNVSAGTILAVDGWAQANDRYEVDAATGVSTVVVDHLPS